MKQEYDVIVVGGGTTGVIAAAQAGRAGASTLLVERNGLLGGTITTAGVPYPALFDAWGRQIIGGIGWELVTRAVAEAGGKLPDFSTPGPKQNSHGVAVNGPLYAALADELVLESGAELLLHAMPAAVERDGDGWRFTVCTKTGLQTLGAKTLVDATGDANLVALAGAPVVRLGERQPGTLVFRIGGYDIKDIDLAALEVAFTAEVDAGRLRRSDMGWTNRPGERAAGAGIDRLLASRGANCIHVCDIDGTDSESRTVAEVKARRILLELYRFLRGRPGLENLRIESLCGECGIRETVVIDGQTTVTLDDYWTGRVFDDAVCYSFYPIDLHLPTGLDFRSLPEGVVPTIPRDALLPKGTRNLLAPGRHLSSDRLANSALRTQATCMATGQAAGAMAAMAAQRGCDVAELPMVGVRALLLAHGAILPE